MHHYPRSQRQEKLPFLSRTPHLELPKIHPLAANGSLNGGNSVDHLECYIHQLAAQQKTEANSLKYLKYKKQIIENKQKRIAQKEEEYRKIRHRHHIRDLYERLQDLKGELVVEERKLSVTNVLQGHMLKQYQQVFDSMNNRLQFCNKVDSSVQVDKEEVVENCSSRVPKIRGQVDYRKKFRVAGLAILFTFIFPKYVAGFKQKRRKYFYQNIVFSGVLFQKAQDFYRLLQSLQLTKLYRDRERQRRKLKDEEPSLDFEEKDRNGIPLKFSIRMGTIAQLAADTLNHIHSILKEQHLQQLLHALSFVVLDRSFLCDHVFLEDQLYQMTVNTAGYMLATPYHQQMLIISLLIAKLTCFMYLLAGKEPKSHFGRNSKMGREDESRECQRVLLFVGLYIFHECNQVLIEGQGKTSRGKGNIEVLHKDYFPVPMADLKVAEDLSRFRVESSEKRVSLENMISSSQLNKPGLKYSQMTNVEELMRVISQNSSSQHQIKDIIISIAQSCSPKLLSHRKDHIRQLRTQMFSQQNSKKHDPIQLKRIPQDLQEIENAINNIETARRELKTQWQPRSLDMEKAKVSATSHQNALPKNGSVSSVQLASSHGTSSSLVSKKSELQQSLTDKQDSMKERSEEERQVIQRVGLNALKKKEFRKKVKRNSEQ